MNNASEKQGKLKHWNENKGFGFITLKNESQDIFIHISALKKMSRRPRIGDIITFVIDIDNNGKKRAINAQIKGLASINPKDNLKKKTKNNTLISRLVFFSFLAIVSYGFYSFYINNKTTPSVKKEQPMIVSLKQKVQNYSEKFSCQGKVYCSQMSSCQEAKFYINNCEGTKMDGNNDGIPCERQWCK